MKTNLSFLAIALLGLSACSRPTPENISKEAVTASVAKSVVGTRSLATDAAYDKPCHLLGEEIVRKAANIGEVEMVEHDLANGCAFEWGGNRVALTFGGVRPFGSVYQAEYSFDKQFKKTVAAVVETPAVDEAAALTGPAPEGTAFAGPAVEHAAADSHHEVAPAVATTGIGTFEPVVGLGDKAVWNAATGALHVLYSNHIINVTVSGKDTPEVRKKHAETMAELILEKVAHGEATL